MNEEIIRKQPFSMIAEQSLLGSVLIDPECLNMIAGEIAPEDFYITEHSKIFDAMLGLYRVNGVIDIVTLIDPLVQGGVYDK